MAKKTKKTRLSNLDAHEVSIVKRGANKKKFLLFKSDEESEMDEILESILKADLENEDQLNTALDKLIPEEVKKSDDYENVKNTLKGTVRLLKSLDGKITDEAISELSNIILKKEEVINDDQTPVEGNMGKEEVSKEAPEMSQETKALFDKNKELIAKNEALVLKFEEKEKESIKKAFDEKAEGFKSLPGEKSDLSTILKEASEKMDKETYEKLESVLKSADSAIEKGEVLKEAGQTGSEGAGAWAKIEKAATEIAKEGKLTHAQAVSVVLDQQPELYKEYNKEQEA